MNNTQLTCRFGKEPTPAYFLTQDAVLCFSPVQGTNYIHPVKEKALPLAVSNNAADFVVFGGFTYASRPPTGTYQAGTEGKNTLLSCPRGAYCDGMLSTNFTLCNPGTFQPLTGQTRCRACPIGYSCNEFGMIAPRICPAHYVCDETGLSNPKPCPTNFICDKGTATLATAFNFGAETCFDNSTDDFGLQASGHPSTVWAERHLMPLDATPLSPPVRGRFCNDDSRLSYRDTDNFQVLDKSFDYSSTGFVLRRPTCIEGTDCKPGISPLSHSCSKGHYCRHGKKKPCRVGTFTLKKISRLRLRTSLKSKLAAIPSKDLAAEGNSDTRFLATLIRSSNRNARRRGLRLPARDYVEREMPLPWTRRNVIISYFWRLKTSRRLLQIQKEIT